MAATIEKMGIPVVTEEFNLPDLLGISKQNMLLGGVPEARQVAVTPDTFLLDYSNYVPQFIDGLTKPLTDKEKASGTYVQPVPARVAMTGTYDEIQTYFQGDLVGHSSVGPVAWMTDGLPITPPTEEAVAQMLKGTRHKPTETITFKNAFGTRVATIEKIAINAVMAGCKPEYMPVVLAIAENGAAVGYSGDSSFGHLYVVSGPISKEIGMNSGFSFLADNNPADKTLQRVAQLMGYNLGGCVIGLNQLERTGGTWGTTFAENSEATPWDTLGKYYGYTSDNSVLCAWKQKVHINPFQNIEVKNATTLEECQAGTPDHIVAALKTLTNVWGAIVVFTPDTAKLYQKKYGWNSIKDVQTYLWDRVTRPAGDWYQNYWFVTHGHSRTIMTVPPGTPKTINPDYLNLPPNTQVPMMWDLKSIAVVVAGGTGDGWTWGPSGAGPGSYGPTVLSIDKWR